MGEPHPTPRRLLTPYGDRQRSGTLARVNLELRLLGALAALILPHLSRGAQAANPLVFRLDPPPVPVLSFEAPPPLVSFSVPKYTLTARERELLAACLVLEAANQGEFGMRSVMAVIRNRARGFPELFAPTVLRAKQFSALNSVTAGRESLARILARAKRDRMWPSALSIVDDALHESWADPTGGATHYTRTGERTPWTRSLAKTVIIGGHSFYR